MRYFPIFLTIALAGLLLGASATQAMDALLGEVVSIDRKSRQMVVAVYERGASAQNAAAPDAGPVRVSYDGHHLPDFVRPGVRVRLWGEYTKTDPSVFKIRAVRSGARGFGRDPTGVRSRLKKECGPRPTGTGMGRGMGRHRGGGRP